MALAASGSVGETIAPRANATGQVVAALRAVESALRALAALLVPPYNGMPGAVEAGAVQIDRRGGDDVILEGEAFSLGDILAATGDHGAAVVDDAAGFVP